MNTQDILQSAIRTIRLEAESVAGLESFVNENFTKAVEAVFNCRGRLVVSGIGKSAIIAQKIVATLNSTGTPGLYMHAADAIHGDLGMVQKDDVVMIISKSGNSPEIKVLVTLIKNFGNTLIGMVGNEQSFLAGRSDIVLNTAVKKEACPNNLAPTTSTTAQLVMGDALAVCLMEMNAFTGKDFARYHPGGILGKKLYLRVADLYEQNQKPMVSPGHTLKEVILEMTKTRLGATAVVDNNKFIVGIVTDGDLRRMLEKSTALDVITAKDIMTLNPKLIGPDALAVQALDELSKYGISQLLVSGNGEYLGMIHMHDLIREGLI
jgi:arabinose-5-phosphate isomerase